MKKLSILLVDNDNTRRSHILISLNSYKSTIVDYMPTIKKKEFEQGKYDIIIIHSGNNPEGGCVENGDWDIGSAKVILFSGGYSQNKSFSDGIFYASASFIEDKENLHTLLNEVLSR